MKITHCNHKANCLSGFTMMEILVGMVVLTIGLLGMAGMTLMVMRGNRGSVDLTAGTDICKNKAVELTSQNWDELGSISDRANPDAATLGMETYKMFQEGSIGVASTALNPYGLTAQGFYLQESSNPGSACNGETATLWTSSSSACQQWVKDGGPYKFARTFVVCSGKDALPATMPYATAPAGSMRATNEPDCLVNPTDESTRSKWLTCEAGDITTGVPPDPLNREKKVKVLCAWRSREGDCHSTHVETTVVRD